MLLQITIGTAVIFLTIVVQCLFISSISSALTYYGSHLAKPPFFMKQVIAMIAIVLWLIVGISISAWGWAGTFLYLDAFDTLEPALYFSVVTFTTLGYGDITVGPQWRILTSFAAVNGLIIFGLNTAFLVEFSSRLRAAQEATAASLKNTLS